MSTTPIDKIRMLRWKARTDVLFLANEILDYKQVEANFHGPIIDLLQKFPKPNYKQHLEHDEWDGKQFKYKPLVKMMALEGKRRSLLLWPRSTFKTTINVQTHVIQWLLNYPNAAIAVFQSNTEKAEMLLQEIKRHFQFNSKLRELFPEYCPPERKAADFGTSSKFTLPCRTEGRREPSVMCLTIEKGTAGVHFDVMKFTDIVEPENVKTKERIVSVKKAFYMAEPLLVTPNHWIDVEGTRYHHEDLYGELMDYWFKQKERGEEPSYKVAVSSCFARKFPDGKPFYTPESLSLPFDKDVYGKPIPVWPVDIEGAPRLSYNNLMELKERDPYIFATQYLNSPQGGAGGLIIFEVNDSYPKKISTSNFYQNVNVVYRVLTVDTAETKGQTSNRSALVIGAFDEANRCYVEDIVADKWLPDELIMNIVNMVRKYNPQTVFIEKTSFVNGLIISLTAALQRAGLYNPIELVARHGQKKIERIQNTLQPWYNSGNLRFVLKEEFEVNSPTRGGIGSDAWKLTLKELESFPAGSDDILDALSDLFTGKEYFGRLRGRTDDNLQSLLANETRLASKLAAQRVTLFEQMILNEPGTVETTSNPNNRYFTGGL